MNVKALHQRRRRRVVHRPQRRYQARRARPEKGSLQPHQLVSLAQSGEVGLARAEHHQVRLWQVEVEHLVHLQAPVLTLARLQQDGRKEGIGEAIVAVRRHVQQIVLPCFGLEPAFGRFDANQGLGSIQCGHALGLGDRAA